MQLISVMAKLNYLFKYSTSHWYIFCFLSSLLSDALTVWRASWDLRHCHGGALWPVGHGSAGVWVLACRWWQSCGRAGRQEFPGLAYGGEQHSREMLSLSLPQQRPAGPALWRSPHCPRHQRRSVAGTTSLLTYLKHSTAATEWHLMSSASYVLSCDLMI